MKYMRIYKIQDTLNGTKKRKRLKTYQASVSGIALSVQNGFQASPTLHRMSRASLTKEGMLIIISNAALKFFG